MAAILEMEHLVEFPASAGVYFAYLRACAERDEIARFREGESW
jgi:hypothetical protein